MTQKHSKFELQSVLEDVYIRFIFNCPEEEYESFERLFFHIEEAHWFYLDHYRAEALKHNIILPNYALLDFAKEVFKFCPHLSENASSVVKYLKSFNNYKSTVPVYGAIILNKARDKVLLVQSYQGTNWSFPKGKINKNESQVQCAIREVKEEIGVDISEHLVEDHFIMDGRQKKIVKLFVVCGISESVEFKPQTQQEIRSMKWFKIEEAKKAPNMPRTIKQLINFLKDHNLYNEPSHHQKNPSPSSPHSHFNFSSPPQLSSQQTSSKTSPSPTTITTSPIPVKTIPQRKKNSSAPSLHPLSHYNKNQNQNQNQNHNHNHNHQQHFNHHHHHHHQHHQQHQPQNNHLHHSEKRSKNKIPKQRSNSYTNPHSIHQTKGLKSLYSPPQQQQQHQHQHHHQRNSFHSLPSFHTKSEHNTKSDKFSMSNFCFNRDEIVVSSQ